MACGTGFYAIITICMLIQRKRLKHCGEGCQKEGAVKGKLSAGKMCNKSSQMEHRSQIILQKDPMQYKNNDSNTVQFI